MVLKGRSRASVGLKFRPAGSSQSQSMTGTKPVPDRSSPQQIFMMVIIHLCRKILFVGTDIKIGIYLFLLFFGSTVGDFLPLPRTYLSDKNNVLNQYFVKLGWGWTFTLVGAFMMLTANIYCCAQRPRVKKHITRLVCATISWYVLTSMFVYIENVTAVCRPRTGRFTSPESCKEAGFKWAGFDISGHSFILIFNSLFIVEEAKVMCGWAAIKDMIRNEDFARANSLKKDVCDTPLQHISDTEYEDMKANYIKYTPHIRILFVLLTMLSILWDVMLFATVLYFHTMVQKMCGGIIAIMAWYFLYRWLYPHGFACLPGKGAFSYQKEKEKVSKKLGMPSFAFKRRSSTTKPPAGKEDIPKFMGMPLYALKNKNDEATPYDASTSK